MDTAAALEDMTQCPVCLEKFTQPKMLPCQHTYCLSCLHSIVQNARSVTCPTCREVHQIPGNGVKGFKDNLIIKNLLELKITSVQATGTCSDCHKNSNLSNCEHCQEPVCVDCRVSHNKITWEIETGIRYLKDVKTDQQDKKDKWTASHGQICEEIDKKSQLFQRLEEKLLKREEEITTSMELVERVHDIFTDHSSKPLLEDLNNRFRNAKSVKALSELKQSVNSVKNTVDTMLSEDGASFSFDTSGLEELEACIDKFGEFTYGEQLLTSGEFASRKRPTKERQNLSQSSDRDRKNSESASEPAQDLVTCLLPSRVNYKYKSSNHNHVTVLKSSLENSKLVNPTAAVYNPDDGKIYVADNDTDRIVQFDTVDGTQKPVFLSFEPNSLAIINGNLYITEKERRLRVGNFQTGHTWWFPEHHFKADYVCSHGSQLVILDSEYGGNAVHVIDSSNSQIIRTFRVAANLILGMAVGRTGLVHLSTQEKGNCSVQVYSLEGHFQNEFEANSEEMGDISRLCVDADGFVSIARPVSDRVDVYSSEGQFLCSVGRGGGKGPGQLSVPTGLSLMPDGRLLVCDSDNNRVQIF